MAKIKIRNDDLTLEIPDGSRLLGYAMEQTRMPFGCTDGECGTCLCTVLKGIENLMPPAHKEWTFLKQKGAYPNQRLACQIWVKKGEVELEY